MEGWGKGAGGRGGTGSGARWLKAFERPDGRVGIHMRSSMPATPSLSGLTDDTPAALSPDPQPRTIAHSPLARPRHSPFCH